jgi:hypothetical protein
MRRSRMIALTGAVALATTALGASAASAGVATSSPMTSTSTSAARAYLVLAKEGVSTKDLSRTLARAGAKVNRTNEAVGLVTVTSTDANFAAKARALDGVRGPAPTAPQRASPRRPRVPTPSTGSCGATRWSTRSPPVR